MSTVHFISINEFETVQWNIPEIWIYTWNIVYVWHCAQYFIAQSKVKVKVLVTQLSLVLYDLLEGSPPVSSVQAILQTRIMEWVAMPCSSGSSGPGIESASPSVPVLQVDSLLSKPPGKSNTIQRWMPMFTLLSSGPVSCWHQIKKRIFSG